MKKIVIVLFVLLLTACSDTVIETTAQLWDELDGNTYNNYDDDFGHGFYFFVEDEIEYCKYMVLDSEGEILGSFNSEISYNEDLTMNIIIPDTLIDKEPGLGTIRPVRVLLEYVDGTIVWDETVFE